jgi:DNA-binding PadR family transcriptional regulator
MAVKRFADQVLVPKLANSALMKAVARKTYDMVQEGKETLRDIKRDPDRVDYHYDKYTKSASEAKAAAAAKLTETTKELKQRLDQMSDNDNDKKR